MMPMAYFGLGSTRHTRWWPKVNAFVARTVFMRLPIRTLSKQAPQYLGRMLGINRLSLLGYHDSDHGQRHAQHGSALQWVDQILANHGVQGCTGEVWLHTFPRVFGYAFKPVSFWFCHREDGTLGAVLVEVHNTFGEQHCYLLLPQAGQSLHNGTSVLADKVFHVSPFFPVRGRYQFRWFTSDKRSVLRIDYLDALHAPHAPDATTLATSIQGQHVPVTWYSCLKVLLAYPFYACLVVYKIHWQALKLWLKGSTLYRHNTKLPPDVTTHKST